jgi:hypothetical protein
MIEDFSWISKSSHSEDDDDDDDDGIQGSSTMRK